MEPGSRPRRPISGAVPEFIREWPTIADGLDRNAGCTYMGQNATAARSERFLDNQLNQPDGLFMPARVMSIRRCRLRTNQTDRSELSVRRAKRLEIGKACLGERI